MKPGDMTTEEQCQMVAEVIEWRKRALMAEAALASKSALREQLRAYVWNCRDGAIEVDDALDSIMSAVVPVDTRLFDLLEGIRERMNDYGAWNRAVDLSSGFSREDNRVQLTLLVNILTGCPPVRSVTTPRKAGDGGSGF